MAKFIPTKKNEALKVISEQGKMIQIKIYLAGHVAEKLILNDRNLNYHQKDKQRAIKLAKQIIFGGIEDDKANLSKEIRERLLKQAYELVQTLEKEVMTLLTEHKEDLEEIVRNLEEHLTLTHEDIKAIMNKETLVPQEEKLTCIPEVAIN